ncbi:hypothetical protein SAMN02745857_00796 [Andreprevotia lacus DSM 23236]|jgi:hypothetical protein|uniref:Uncharacterized protein n=1 Tax=Andreprevotia lacus DSM 23236 TaxID=1121001 RepID=A0A1W1X7H2_9NEIS|nr:hypothetical protein [Andreprevotia lacus]SMC19790.1 hypothetical protein SAMN02745857_00796 [Andreprevotia lacus DSM 23236]
MRRTPPEKKRLSLAKDRRNAYGECPTSSRRNIRRNKQFSRRAARHGADAMLRTATLDEESAANAEVRARGSAELKRRQGFRKSPDIALATIIASKQARRARLRLQPRRGKRSIKASHEE